MPYYSVGRMQGIKDVLYRYDAEEISDARKYEKLADELRQREFKDESEVIAGIARDERKHSKRLNQTMKSLQTAITKENEKRFQRTG